MSLGDLGVIGERISQGPALAFLILTLALILGPKLAEKVRLPAMVGLVLAGMVVGPHAERLLDTNRIALSALGEFGLLYLMFAAGLELDLKLFARMKKAALTFATLSFAVPFLLGVAGARLLGYGWAASVLMGSNWGSHTLVTYPILRQMGLARNAAVATVVGATAVTDTSALLVLTGVSASVKHSGSLTVQGLEIAVGLAVLALWTLLVLPRLARWFFARVGGDRSYRFVFGIAAFLSGAVLAEAATIDGIVGAFFAGLGLNRAIPERSPLMEQIQFFGSAWFIPIFLVSVGVLLDPRVLIDPRTLLVALVFSLAVLGGKAVAAVIAGRAFRFGWPEIGVMSGLSGSQAAATLATTLVGARLGLFDTRTVNAVLVVILVSLVVTPALVTYFGKKVTREDAAAEALGGTVLVPVRGESSRPLFGVAGRLAAADGGMVVAASVATEKAPGAQLAAQRSLREQAEDWLAREGLEARAVFRVARSVPAGLLHILQSEEATLPRERSSERPPRSPRARGRASGARAFSDIRRDAVPRRHRGSRHHRCRPGARPPPGGGPEHDRAPRSVTADVARTLRGKEGYHESSHVNDSRQLAAGRVARLDRLRRENRQHRQQRQPREHREGRQTSHQRQEHVRGARRDVQRLDPALHLRVATAPGQPVVPGAGRVLRHRRRVLRDGPTLARQRRRVEGLVSERSIYMGKVIQCAAVDPSSGCTHVVHGNTEEEVLKNAMEHAKEHGIRQATPELMAKVKGAIRDEK